MTYRNVSAKPRKLAISGVSLSCYTHPTVSALYPENTLYYRGEIDGLIGYTVARFLEGPVRLQFRETAGRIREAILGED